jgi:hypothetical protein
MVSDQTLIYLLPWSVSLGMFIYSLLKANHDQIAAWFIIVVLLLIDIVIGLQVPFS